MIQWQYFPKCDAPTRMARVVVGAFEQVSHEIANETHDYTSNIVLSHVAAGLRDAGFTVEGGKTAELKITVPVLFGANGITEKAFDADAHHEGEGFVVEVEAGRGVVNNQFLKDFFQACMMHDVHYLAIAVRKTYKGNRDYDRVITFFETLYASRRLTLPLKGVLILGY